MATNLYFNNFPVNQVTNEQLLVEDLLIEAMKIYGIDVYYLPRTSDNATIDKLYGELPYVDIMIHSGDCSRYGEFAETDLFMDWYSKQNKDSLQTYL